MLYYEWDPDNRSAFQKLIEMTLGVGVKNLRIGNRVLVDALVDGESIQGVDSHIDSVNGVLFRVTRLGRRLNAFYFASQRGFVPTMLVAQGRHSRPRYDKTRRINKTVQNLNLRYGIRFEQSHV